MFSSLSRGIFRRKRPKNSGQHILLPEQTMQAEHSSTARRRDAVRSHPSGKLKQRDEGNPFYRLRSEFSSPRIIAVGGGKGGIGKSFFSASLGLDLARQNLKTYIADLDLGAANLHTCLGIPLPQQGLMDFVNGDVSRLDDIANKVGSNKLHLLSGGQDFHNILRMSPDQKASFIHDLRNLNANCVVLDLGAGTHSTTLDFFIFSHLGVLVVVPEPTSIENAYVFLKSILYRKVQSVLSSYPNAPEGKGLLVKLTQTGAKQPPINCLRDYAQRYPQVGHAILDFVESTHLSIVINQARTKADREIGVSMAKISRKYFGFQTNGIGDIRYSDTVWKSVRMRKPLSEGFPGSPALKDLEQLTYQLVDDLARREEADG